LLSLSLSDLPRDTLTPLTAFQLGPKALSLEKEDTKEVPEATVTDRQRRGWKAVTRRIMTSLLNLYCCVPLSKKRQKASNRVVPKAQVDTQQKHRRPEVPMLCNVGGDGVDPELQGTSGQEALAAACPALATRGSAQHRNKVYDLPLNSPHRTSGT
jgi:hypothetical protein